MTVEQWASAVGFAMPILVAIINRPEWKPWLKALVALLASVAGGTVTALLAGGFSGATWITSIGIVFGSSQIFYHTWFKNSEITKWIEDRINVILGKATVREDGTPGDSDIEAVTR